jgi:dTDP-4-amino-4,6-dideoxygalactose transaminase
MRKIAFLDLRVNDPKDRRTLLKAVEKVLSHGRILLGPEVDELEERIARYCHRKFAVGVNSGTDALILGLMSLGIGPGDEVITTALSWIATANAIAMVGATPVFADIGDDFNIDPESVKRMISPKTKAIIPVHYTGRICRMDSLLQIAKKNHLLIIEDAAQAFGASYKGKIAGSFGDMACFSMNPMKIFGALGEAGMVLTDDREISFRLKYLRYNGTVKTEQCIATSLNGRIDTVQAAMLLIRLPKVAGIIRKRRLHAAYYRKHLSDISQIRLPRESSAEKNIYYTFMIRAEKRDELKKYLELNGIETKIQHPILMSDQQMYRNNPCDSLTNARKFVKEILCLPISEKLSVRDLEYTAKIITNFYNE